MTSQALKLKQVFIDNYMNQGTQMKNERNEKKIQEVQLFPTKDSNLIS